MYPSSSLNIKSGRRFFALMYFMQASSLIMNSQVAKPAYSSSDLNYSMQMSLSTGFAWSQTSFWPFLSARISSPLSFCKISAIIAFYRQKFNASFNLKYSESLLWNPFYPTNRYPLPTTVSIYPSPIFLRIWLTTFVTALPQFIPCSFHTAS